MSILITGLDMPTERESFNLTIKYNGTVLDTETGIQVAEAHELQPHGRLIDADALDTGKMIDVYISGDLYRHEWNIDEWLNSAPTIIPASEEGET